MRPYVFCCWGKLRGNGEDLRNGYRQRLRTSPRITFVIVPTDITRLWWDGTCRHQASHIREKRGNNQLSLFLRGMSLLILSFRMNKTASCSMRHLSKFEVGFLRATIGNNVKRETICRKIIIITAKRERLVSMAQS